MTVLTRAQLRELTTHPADQMVSLFMPTRPTYAQLRDNLDRLERLILTAEHLLMERGLRRSEAEGILLPIRNLRQHELFWCSNGDGLAAFSSRLLFRAYRVPWHLGEEVFVGSSFNVAPLLPLLESGGRFYILALTEDSARLYEASQHSIQQISLPLHGQGAPSSSGHRRPTYYGTKATYDFCDRVNSAVNKILQGDNSPLVLACVGHLSEIYRSQNSYGRLLNAKIPGNPSLWTVDELRQRAWGYAAPEFRQQKERALQQFSAAAGSERTACDVEEVIQAANQGRIDTLLVAQRTPAGHGYDVSAASINDSRTTSDLLCYAATQTLSHGGAVYMVERMPIDHSPVAALLRSRS